VVEFLCWLVRIYLVVMVARAILSWFPPSTTSGGVATLQRLLMDLTEPVLAPLRRVIPPAGMFDLSFMVAFFGLLILQGVICSA
jgi:YggT family protein